MKEQLVYVTAISCTLYFYHQFIRRTLQRGIGGLFAMNRGRIQDGENGGIFGSSNHQLHLLGRR